MTRTWVLVTLPLAIAACSSEDAPTSRYCGEDGSACNGIAGAAAGFSPNGTSGRAGSTPASGAPGGTSGAGPSGVGGAVFCTVAGCSSTPPAGNGGNGGLGGSAAGKGGSGGVGGSGGNSGSGGLGGSAGSGNSGSGGLGGNDGIGGSGGSGLGGDAGNAGTGSIGNAGGAAGSGFGGMVTVPVGTCVRGHFIPTTTSPDGESAYVYEGTSARACPGDPTTWGVLIGTTTIASDGTFCLDLLATAGAQISYTLDCATACHGVGVITDTTSAAPTMGSCVTGGCLQLDDFVCGS